MIIRVATLAAAAALAFSTPAAANQSPLNGGSSLTAGVNLLENRSEQRICHICPGRPRNVCRCS
jgi:hypothetical protein